MEEWDKRQGVKIEKRKWRGKWSTLSCPNPRWEMVGTPGRRNTHELGKSQLWRNRGYSRGSNETLRDRDGSEKGLKSLGSNIWNMSFRKGWMQEYRGCRWGPQVSPLGIHPGSFNQELIWEYYGWIIITPPTPSHSLVCFLKVVTFNCSLEGCDIVVVLNL